jgi:hypothetical protein
MKPADKHFRCNICQRGFTRIDHLKRHHLRRMCPTLQLPSRTESPDSGQKPYSCVFCNDSFARWYVTCFSKLEESSSISVTISATTIRIAPDAGTAKSPRPARGVDGDMLVNLSVCNLIACIFPVLTHFAKIVYLDEIAMRWTKPLRIVPEEKPGVQQ